MGCNWFWPSLRCGGLSPLQTEAGFRANSETLGPICPHRDGTARIRLSSAIESL
jgi:hypothetical protein